jgi:phage terminase large subunit
MVKTTNKVDGFQYTTAIKKLRKLKKRIRGVPGGTSAGKTFGILPILIDQAARTPGLEISVVSESIPHLRKGALKDFLKIMKATGRYNDANYNRTLLTYTFANGSYIEFFSADQEGKVRGPRRHILYINECNNITFETFHQLSIRTSETIWLDFNPSNEFWYHTELAEDTDFEELVLTYKDNEALSDSIIREIEKAKSKAYFDSDLELPDLLNASNIKNYYWHNWWKVYGLGLVGTLEGVIFTNWKQIDAVPREARLLGYAIDFGYTNDPTTLVAAYQWNGKIIWDELIYQTGMTNGDIANRMKSLEVRHSDFIIADSAEPKSIAEINRYGFHVIPADKGPDSINFGIDVLQEEEFYVTKRSTNMIKELRKYMWDKDKTGKTLNKPVDAFNHCIDPMRYLATAKMSKHKQKRGLRRRN